MALAAGIVFGSSLVGIILLFALKRYESARQRTIGGPWRAHADVFALEVKRAVMIIEWYIARTPILLLILARASVHVGALGFARLMRALEEFFGSLEMLGQGRSVWRGPVPVNHFHSPG